MFTGVQTPSVNSSPFFLLFWNELHKSGQVALTLTSLPQLSLLSETSFGIPFLADTLTSLPKVLLSGLAVCRYQATLTLLLLRSLFSSAALAFALRMGREQRPAYLPVFWLHQTGKMMVDFQGDSAFRYFSAIGGQKSICRFQVCEAYQAYLSFWNEAQFWPSMLLILTILRLISFLRTKRLMDLPCLKGRVSRSSKSCCIAVKYQQCYNQAEQNSSRVYLRRSCLLGSGSANSFLRMSSIKNEATHCHQVSKSVKISHQSL